MKKLIKHWNITLAVLLIIVLGGMIVLAPLFNRLSPYAPPLLEHELNELTPDWSLATNNNWSPWYTLPDGTTEWNPAASYNAWLATIPEADKAWPQITRLKEHYKHNEYKQFNTELLYQSMYGKLPDEPNKWKLIQPVLGSPLSDDLLEGLKEALAKPILGCVLNDGYGPYEHAAIVEFDDDFDPGPLDYDPQANTAFHNIMQGWVGDLTRLFKFLKSRGAYELEAGNADAFVEIVELMFNSAHHAAALPTFLGQIVEFSIQDRSMELMSWGLEHHRDQLTEDHLRTFEAMLAKPTNFQVRWQGESLVFHDSIRRLIDARGVLKAPKEDQTSSWDFKFPDPVHLTDDQLDPSTQRVLMVHNLSLRAMVKQGQLPWDQSATTAQQIVAEHDGLLTPQGKRYLDIFAPGYDRIANALRARSQRALGLRTAIAAHRHRLRHGQFPFSLEVIDPDLMPFDPIDAFTNQPLRYEILGQNPGQSAPDDPSTMPVIYSIGHDRADNAATPAYSVVMMDKLVINESTGEKEVIEVEVRTVLSPEWTTGPKEYAQGLTPPKERWGDWILFPVPMDDPKPRDYEYNDLTGELEWIEESDW